MKDLEKLANDKSVTQLQLLHVHDELLAKLEKYKKTTYKKMDFLARAIYDRQIEAEEKEKR